MFLLIYLLPSLNLLGEYLPLSKGPIDKYKILNIAFRFITKEMKVSLCLFFLQVSLSLFIKGFVIANKTKVFHIKFADLFLDYGTVNMPAIQIKWAIHHNINFVIKALTLFKHTALTPWVGSYMYNLFVFNSFIT